MKNFSTFTPAKKITREESFIWHPKWLLIARFFAVIGVTLVTIISNVLFHIKTLNYIALWILTLILLISNLCYWLYYRMSSLSKQSESTETKKHISIFTMIQINIDLIIFTLMLHFSGGATNPFVVYYLFYITLSSIMFSKKAAYTETSVAALMFCIMTIFEGFEIIKHYAILQPVYHTQITFIIGMCFTLTPAFFISAYVTTFLTQRLKIHRNELEQALEKTEQLEIEKSLFLNIVAHDLKSSVASIDTTVKSTLSDYRDKIPPDVKHVMGHILKHTNNLLKFIKDFLDFSILRNMNRLQMKFTPLNFLPIVTATVEMYMNQALDKNIKIKLNSAPDIPTIQGIKDYLEHMIANLISNAIIYTPENGSINIKVTSENDEVILTVADTGIGIPEDAFANIFIAFFRADNARKLSSTGTGLGLPIAKTIAEKHSGIISAKSTEGEGTVFTVKLPAISS